LKFIDRVLKDPKTSREVLQSLRLELLDQMKAMEERLAKIDTLLGEDEPALDENCWDSPSFQMITGILGADQIEKYSLSCPEIFDQHRKLNTILDDFNWGEDHQEGFRVLTEYFKTHPEQYQTALELGARWQEISQLSEDDPQIEAAARESAILVSKMTPVKELICNHQGMQKPLGGLYQQMVSDVLTPAQLKYQQLFEKFLSAQD
jgi:hypothetical protein